MSEENVTDGEIVEEGNVEESTPVEPEKVYPRQNVAGPEWDVHDTFLMQTEVHLWEQMSEASIAFNISQLEQSELQVRGTMEQIEANGGKGNQDWKKLEGQHNEIIRKLEHFKKTVQPDDIIYKAQTVGFTNVHGPQPLFDQSGKQVSVSEGVDWNRALRRHVVVNDTGKVIRVLVRPPV